MDTFDLDLFDDIVFEVMGAPIIAGVGYYLNNYHPLDFHPDYYWTKPTAAVVSGGGVGAVVLRYPAIIPKKKRTDEELILMMYAMIDEDY